MVFSLLLKLLFFNSLIAKVESQCEVGAMMGRERGKKHSLSAFRARHYSHRVSSEALLFCCRLVTIPNTLTFPCLVGLLLLLVFWIVFFCLVGLFCFCLFLVVCFVLFFPWLSLTDLTQNLPAIHEISGINFGFPLLKWD